MTGHDCRRVVIVGGSHAGFTVASTLRDKAFDGEVVVLDAHDGLPYQRPPLSKAYLYQGGERAGLAFRPASYYAERDIELRMGERVAALRPGERVVMTASGDRIRYSELVLATGARNRTIGLEGAELDGVVSLRTAAEAESLRARMADAESVVVLGGGFIGLEVAAAAATLGVPRVTVVEAADRTMKRAVSEPISAYFEDRHRAAGTCVLTEVTATRLLGEDGHVIGVDIGDGELIAADLVVVGVGVIPNIELAADAGLATGLGIEVDNRLRTSVSDIFAIGDCAAFPVAGRYTRLESVQNATDQARCVAAQLVGEDVGYSAVPWFWTEQLGQRLQIAGLSQFVDDIVVQGAAMADSFGVFGFARGQLVCVESINRPGEHMAARRLLAAADPVDRESVVGDDFDLVGRARAIAQRR